MRLRALPLLLVLTAADYAFWDWSIAGGHDLVSLISGLTLLPLAAATLAMLAVGAGRLLSLALEHPATRRRSAAGDAAKRRASAHDAQTAVPDPHHADAAERERSSRRLAA